MPSIRGSHYVIDTATGTIGGMGEHGVQATAAARLGTDVESSAA